MVVLPESHCQLDYINRGQTATGKFRLCMKRKKDRILADEAIKMERYENERELENLFCSSRHNRS